MTTCNANAAQEGLSSSLSETPGCHESESAAHPDHHLQLNRLRRVEGQLRGIQKMVEERRYCMDIIAQIRAASGALRQVELGILKDHLNHCVRDALGSSHPEAAETKIQEIIQLLDKAS